MFQTFQSQLSSSIANLKNYFYSKVAKRLLDPSTSPKTHWSYWKKNLNNKKIPVISSIFHDNKFTTYFKQKAEIFNSYFSKQCKLSINNSKIPLQCRRKSNESLSSKAFEINDIEKIIKVFDPNKSHSHDILNICMLKLCGESIHKTLKLIFKLVDIRLMKKTNVVPVFKIGDKQLLKNYRPILVSTTF